MTKFQKIVCICFSFFFVLMLLQMTNPVWIAGDLYRQLPLYCFLEERYRAYPLQEDEQVSELMIQKNAEYIAKEMQVQSERETAESENLWLSFFTKQKQYTETWSDALKSAMAEKVEEAMSDNVQTMQVEASPLIDLSAEKLADMDYLLNQFYIIDSNTDAAVANLDAEEFLAKDLSIEKNTEEPQILIYHSHSQETFADSREGYMEDTIVGVGAYLAEILRDQYGYQVLHVTEAFDMAEGELDRSSAYDYSRAYVENLLKDYPSIEVIIDLHRDGVEEGRRLVANINGKDTAQIMFYNGLSYTKSYGAVDYLPNPYIQDNLAFSFQLEYQAALYYPELYRGIYLAGLRYNLHLKPRALLLEAGAQTNTVQEVKNAMEPFADILNRVLCE